MWPFRNKRHLRYGSVEAWLAGERVPTPITQVFPLRRQARLLEQLTELRQHLWQRHVAGLPPPEQQLFAASRHPCQSHEFADAAVPYVESLREQLLAARVPFQSVSLGFYHLDRLVLAVRLAVDVDFEAERLRVPPFHRGFEVKLGGARTSTMPPNPALERTPTAGNAGSVGDARTPQ